MKPLHFIGSSLKDLRDFPEDVRQEAGYSLYLSQIGGKAINTVPMVGFGGAKVLEVVIDDDGDTYRAIYTVKFVHAIYVLHAFQKKSKKGNETPKPDMKLIRERLKVAENHHNTTYKSELRKEKANERGA
jgi:phage-related protein